MNARCLLLLVCLWPLGALAQGFAGLGTTSEGFAVPDPAYQLQFPKDHGAHPGFRIEWWYLTANLQDAKGADYGVQWTLFRTEVSPDGGEGWQTPVLWMGHAGMTGASWHYHSERLARGGTGQAGVALQPFEAWIDEWSMTETSAGYHLRASGTDFAYALDLAREGPIVLQGDQGFSVKSREGQASHYYSLPFLTVTGQLETEDGPVEVTGQAWMDREWSSQPLSEGQSGWDWISLHLEGGAKLMGFRLRDDAAGAFTSATYVTAEGTPTPLGDGALRMTPMGHSDVNGRSIPTRWHVVLEAFGVDVTLDALNSNAWIGGSFPYWEGPVSVTGSHDGAGYLEMTGYE